MKLETTLEGLREFDLAKIARLDSRLLEVFKTACYAHALAQALDDADLKWKRQQGQHDWVRSRADEILRNEMGMEL